jgi:hypothetical protein
MNTRRLRLEVEASEPKQAVEVQHDGKAEFVQAVPVQGEPGGQTVWDAAVHVFNLSRHVTPRLLDLSYLSAWACR